MKTFKINIPEGHEIDQEKSTFEEIVFKKKEPRLPTSVDEIEGRDWYIDVDGSIFCDKDYTENQVSSKERAEAFLALMQLVELRDAWNEGWVANWNSQSQRKYTISSVKGELMITDVVSFYHVLHFKSKELAYQFREQFKDLLDKAKELL